jgi:hypothetical protein
MPMIPWKDHIMQLHKKEEYDIKIKNKKNIKNNNMRNNGDSKIFLNDQNLDFLPKFFIQL